MKLLAKYAKDMPGAEAFEKPFPKESHWGSRGGLRAFN